MKDNPGRSQIPSELPSALNHRLNSYALAATAGGVGMLAMAQPAQAKIVYTKTHKVVGNNGVVELDLNHDRVIDFLLLQSSSSAGNGSADVGLYAREALGNAVEGFSDMHGPHDSALKTGTKIGPGVNFVTGSYGESMARSWSTNGSGPGHSGQWWNVSNRYLGFKFLINGKAHYGWARMSVKVSDIALRATLTGYAYETVPGKPILAGRTSTNTAWSNGSLGSLARGMRNARPEVQQ